LELLEPLASDVELTLKADVRREKERSDKEEPSLKNPSIDTEGAQRAKARTEADDAKTADCSTDMAAPGNTPPSFAAPKTEQAELARQKVRRLTEDPKTTESSTDVCEERRANARRLSAEPKELCCRMLTEPWLIHANPADALPPPKMETEEANRE
jgi:hypothetical protein